MPTQGNARPIGIFDSGVGGLSVLRELLRELPHERFVYVSDSGHAPYGEREDQHVIQRSHAIANYLMQHHHAKALVVACNTATAGAIQQLRNTYTNLPIVGIEPALKPAAAHSTTRRIGVMATRGTLQSEKFRMLLAGLQDQAEFVLQPCDGLADAIERMDATQTVALCTHFTGLMGSFGNKSGEIDALVLGCTHYPFAAHALQSITGPTVTLFEAGAPVARQTARLLRLSGTRSLQPALPPRVALRTTGDPQSLEMAAQKWLGLLEPALNTHSWD